jgi:hypothetical protein
VLGSNAANDYCRADIPTSISALVAVIMRALCIARAPASKRHIAFLGIRRLMVVRPSQKRRCNRHKTAGRYYYHGTVTRPELPIENIKVFRPKNEHPRSPFSPPVSYVYSDWQPSWRPHWPDPAGDLSIPAFLRRPLPQEATASNDAVEPKKLAA